MMLEPRDPVLYFVQRLRDEAHRFAIGTHRAKRGKAIGANPLDEIAGIGPTRKRALLKHFGSAKAVSRASTEDLQAVERHQRADGADDLRLLPRAPRVAGSLPGTPSAWWLLAGIVQVVFALPRPLTGSTVASLAASQTGPAQAGRGCARYSAAARGCSAPASAAAGMCSRRPAPRRAPSLSKVR